MADIVGMATSRLRVRPAKDLAFHDEPDKSDADAEADRRAWTRFFFVFVCLFCFVLCFIFILIPSIFVCSDRAV
jgi:hypothetical protein